MNDNFNFEDLFGEVFDDSASVVPATTAKPAKKAEKKSAKKETKKAATATESKEKKAMVKVADAKDFFFGDKKIAIPEGAFKKKNVTEEEVAEAFVTVSKQSLPACVFAVRRGRSATGKEDGILIGYKNDVLGDGDTLPSTFLGYRIVTPEGTKDVDGDVTLKYIRDALTDSKFSKYADPAYGFIANDSEIYAIPIASKFKVPFATTISVQWDGSTIDVSFAPKTTEAATPAAGSAEDGDEAEVAEESTAVESKTDKEIDSTEILKGFSKAVNAVGFFGLAKLSDDTIVAVPSTENQTITPETHYIPEDEIERPITPDLKIFWTVGELSLYNLPAEGDKLGTVGMTTISEKKALEILKSRFPVYRFINHMTWFEDLHYWYPNYPSSTKGGGAAMPLFSVENDTVHWLAPKVPGLMLAHIVTAFAYTEANSGVEQAASILFDTRTQAWRVSFPTQDATPTRVTCNFAEEAEVPFEVVGVQLHSHPNMSISFSSIDDRDELSEQTLFCVVRRNGSKHAIDCRVRHNGKFIAVPLSIAFDLP